jgi:8-oxo-dGTP pyrophosphatase MutT (NUDIX family)
VLRRKLPQPQPLIDRLQRLRDRLSARPVPPDDADPALLWAAVALVLVPFPDAFLLIRRAERLGDPWSGHMALPGGRREPSDDDLVATAMREVHEEVGLTLERSQLVGRLADVIPRTPVLPPVAVRPFVFGIPSRLPVILSHEVSAASWVPIDHLLHPETYSPVQIVIRGETREFPAYHLEDSFVWGMTERIVTELLEEFRRSES